MLKNSLTIERNGENRINSRLMSNKVVSIDRLSIAKGKRVICESAVEIHRINQLD